jgi:phosphohistidine phosphatase
MHSGGEEAAMDVVVLRHGPAEERQPVASEEQEQQRPLSEQGRRRVRRGVRGLAKLVPSLEAIATSPLARAAQTAELAGAHYAGLKPVVLPALEPGGARDAVAAWLATRRPDASVMLVGHSPDLEELAAWLLAGVSRPLLQLSKAGACLLRIESLPGPASAELVWSLPARVLRRLA